MFDNPPPNNHRKTALGKYRIRVSRHDRSYVHIVDMIHCSLVMVQQSGNPSGGRTRTCPTSPSASLSSICPFSTHQDSCHHQRHHHHNVLVSVVVRYQHHHHPYHQPVPCLNDFRFIRNGPHPFRAGSRHWWHVAREWRFAWKLDVFPFRRHPSLPPWLKTYSEKDGKHVFF